MPVCAPKFDSILASVTARCALKVIDESVVSLGMCSSRLEKKKEKERREEEIVYVQGHSSSSVLV